MSRPASITDRWYETNRTAGKAARLSRLRAAGQGVSDRKRYNRARRRYASRQSVQAVSVKYELPLAVNLVLMAAFWIAMVMAAYAVV